MISDEFLASVSHELRQPLTGVLAMTEVLQAQSYGPLNERQHEYVGYVMSSSTALLAIVNDILDLATIDAGIMELDLAEIDVAETVEAAVEGLRDRLHEGGFLITISGTLSNVLRLQPPLSITSAQIDLLIAALRDALHAVRKGA